MNLSLIKNTKKNINFFLKRSRHSDLNNVIFSYLNINSIRLDKIVNGDIDILCKAETKLDESFPNNQLAYQYNQSIYTTYYRQQRWLHGIWLNHTYRQGGLTV